VWFKFQYWLFSVIFGIIIYYYTGRYILK